MAPIFFINAREAERCARGIRKIRLWVRAVLEAAKVKGSPHVFRDTFAINLLAAGVDIFTVSQLLDQSNVKITQQHDLNFIPPISSA